MSPYDVKIHTHTCTLHSISLSPVASICVNLPMLSTLILWLLPNEQKRSECLFCSLLWLFDITYSVGWAVSIYLDKPLNKVYIVAQAKFSSGTTNVSGEDQKREIHQRTHAHVCRSVFLFTFSMTCNQNEYEFWRSKSNKMQNMIHVEMHSQSRFFAQNRRISFHNQLMMLKVSDETTTQKLQKTKQRFLRGKILRRKFSGKTMSVATLCTCMVSS